MPERGLAAAPATCRRPQRSSGAILIAILVPLLFLWAFWDRQINQDTAWFLVATQKWLEGAQLYVDLVEVNPPLNFYLTVPAVLIGQATGAGPVNGQYIALALMLSGALFSVGRILTAASFPSPARRDLFHAGTAVALVIPALGDVGQREHIMVLLVTPWLVAELVDRPPSHGLRGGAMALVAAVGICLKPFFILIPLSVTIWQISRRRSFAPVLSPTNLVMLATGVAYVTFVAIRHPEYLYDIVPIALLVYGEYGLSDASVIAFMRPYVIGLFLIFAGIVGFGDRSVPNVSFWVLLITGTLACYLIQWTGYSYQVVPVYAFVTMALFWIMAHAGFPSRTAPLAAIGLVVVLLPTVVLGPYREPLSTELAEKIRAQGNGVSFAALSTFLQAGHPTTLDAGAVWASRYPSLWMIPGVLNGLALNDCTTEPDVCAALIEIRNRTRRDIITDLSTARPDVLVIDNRPGYVRVDDFSWDAFLSEDPRYAGIMAAYTVKSVDAGLSILVRNVP